jgi:hypothetical protein
MPMGMWQIIFRTVMAGRVGTQSNGISREIGHFGFWIVDFGSKSAIRNPKMAPKSGKCNCLGSARVRIADSLTFAHIQSYGYPYEDDT